MAGGSGFYSGEKKKTKKPDMEKKAKKEMSTSGPFVMPTIEIIGKGKKKDW